MQNVGGLDGGTSSRLGSSKALNRRRRLGTSQIETYTPVTATNTVSDPPSGRIISRLSNARPSAPVCGGGRAPRPRRGIFDFVTDATTRYKATTAPRTARDRRRRRSSSVRRYLTLRWSLPAISRTPDPPPPKRTVTARAKRPPRRRGDSSRSASFLHSVSAKRANGAGHWRRLAIRDYEGLRCRPDPRNWSLQQGKARYRQKDGGEGRHQGVSPPRTISRLHASRVSSCGRHRLHTGFTQTISLSLSRTSPRTVVCADNPEAERQQNCNAQG